MIKMANAQHQAFRSDAIALLRKYSSDLDGKEFLALASHLVGQIIAHQDQRVVTREIALEIVMRNIEQGNLEVLDDLQRTRGNA